MPTFGKITPFDQSEETWGRYIARMKQYFLANDIVDAEKKKNIFLTSVGAKTFNVLYDLLASEDPATKTYDQLIDALTAHFSPKPSEILESYRFRSRYRLPGESIPEFVANLRRLASTCDFDAASLDRTLRDQFVVGIEDEAIQQRLFEEQTLTFEKATSIAVAVASATRNTKEIKGTASVQLQQVHKMAVHPGHKSKQKTVKAKESGSIKHANPCMRCGNTDHTPPNCPYMAAICRNCGIAGHLAKKCLTQNASRGGRGTSRGKYRQNVHAVQQPTTIYQPQDKSYDHLFRVDATTKAPSPIMRECQVNGHYVTFELDTGAAYSLVPEAVYKGISNSVLNPSNIVLKSFTGQEVKILGSINVNVGYQGVEQTLPLMVYLGNGPNLCGRNWIASKLSLLGVSIHSLADTGWQQQLHDLLKKHRGIFEDGVGTMKGIKVHLNTKPDAQPKFAAARPVPYALRDKVDTELMRLEKAGIISPVGYSEYATPVVTVLKKDNTVRLCGDYKSTVNPNLDTECYPLPRVEDIFAKLAGGEKFTKLDLKDAFNQLELDEESRKIVVINTPKGLFQYNRLPFGISSAPAVFQRVIENLIQGIPFVSNFQDDILITGKNDETHLQSLSEVLRRIQDSGLKLRRDKCAFFETSVSHLGYLIDKEGLHPLKAKLEAIMQAPAPTSVEQLRSFLGMITYYGKFIPNQATLFAPLYRLLNKDQTWLWGTEQVTAFQAAKEAVCEKSVLVHYNPKQELLLACDASPYGLGAVLSHPGPNGTDRPIAFASRSLTQAEKNYSQLEREALSLIFGVTRFRDYLIGHTFTLQTDHQPLVSLLSERKPIPRMAASRIQRWALILAAYSYKMVYRKGKHHGNADALSRLPLEVGQINVPEPAELVLLAEEMDKAETPISAGQVVEGTLSDLVMSKVLAYVREGWPHKHTVKSDEIMSNYYAKRLEISSMKGVLLWGSRVIVPPGLRKGMLKELHDGHQGMTLMKSLARSKVWWPGIDSDIERWVACCSICQQTAPMPAANVYAPWPKASNPWDKIHVDYAGPIEGKMLLVVVDSYSKWIEVEIVPAASASATAVKLRKLFSTYGLPYTVVSDNGTHFTGKEVTQFLKENGVKHLTIAPYHPASNGQAERAVRVIKQGLNKITSELLQELKKTSGSMQMRLDRLLINYRRTPVTSTGRAPAELFLGRSIRTRLDSIFPRRTIVDQEQVVSKHNGWSAPGNMVFARNYGKGSKWLPGEISRKLGTAMFEVSTPSGNIRRHLDQIRPRKIIWEPADKAGASIPRKENLGRNESVNPSGSQNSSDQEPVLSTNDGCVTGPSVVETALNDAGSETHRATPIRRSTRVHRPPDRLDL